MARKPVPLPLNLGDSSKPDHHDQNDFLDRSPLSPKSPKSPRSPFRFNNSKKAQSDQPMQPSNWQPKHVNLPSTISLSSTAPNQSEGAQSQQEKERVPRTGFFTNYKASKSSSRLQNNSDGSKQGEEDMSRDSDHPAMSGQVSSKENSRSDTTDPAITRKPVATPLKPDSAPESAEPSPQSALSNNLSRNRKPKPFGILSRTKSTRDEENMEPMPDNKLLEVDNYNKDSAKTAPLLIEGDRSFRAMMNSSVRQHSADRVPSSSSRDRSREKRQRDNSSLRPKDAKDNVRSQTNVNLSKEHNRTQTTLGTSFREGGGGHTFLNNLKSTATKGAGAISKGLFGKSGRSGSSSEREPAVDDEHYQIKVLNLPLVQQTRLTRISKKLEDSRDKTEFWMPAFPWRAIDYLNYKGSDVEGLYRVPGSTPEVKRWQRRFDQEHDIDLFEEADLYDINIIGSMLKAWLRELPDELFPKAAQNRISLQCKDSETVPQMLIDELSNLSPFNYYLLFAITCHLSLLLAHSDKNKMDFRNLCICFQPCMKIDAVCFKFLVCDWRECWKGCKTEEQYIQQEYMLFDMIPPSSAEGRSSIAVESHDERNVSSSDSSKPSSVSIVDTNAKNSGGHHNKPLPLSQPMSQDNQDNDSTTMSTTLTVAQDRTPPRISADMRPLSPIKPLSPIGF